MKCKLIFVLMVILSFCFFPLASAITYEGGTGVNAGGIVFYDEKFQIGQTLGLLTVATTFENRSGIMYCPITVKVTIFGELAFKLRIYDSDQGDFINQEIEDGVGEKERRFTVMAGVDKNDLQFISSVTDLDGIIIFASITLQYYFDADALAGLPGGINESIPWEEYERLLEEMEAEKRASMWRTIGSFAISFPLGTFLCILSIKRLKGGEGKKVAPEDYFGGKNDE